MIVRRVFDLYLPFVSHRNQSHCSYHRIEDQLDLPEFDYTDSSLGFDYLPHRHSAEVQLVSLRSGWVLSQMLEGVIAVEHSIQALMYPLERRVGKLFHRSKLFFHRSYIYGEEFTWRKFLKASCVRR